MRKRVAEELRDHSKNLDAELRERRERLKRTMEKMAGLADFLAGGERSQYIVTTLRDHETFVKQEREAIEQLEDEARMPIRLPSIDEVEAQVLQLDARLKQDPESAREQLRRWLKDGAIKLGPREDGAIVAEGTLLPLMVIGIDQTPRNPKMQLPETNPLVSGRYTVVAGARFRVRTPGSDSGFVSKGYPKPILYDVDFDFLDYLAKKAIESIIPLARPGYGVSMIRSLARKAQSSPSGRCQRRSACFDVATVIMSSEGGPGTFHNS